MTKHSKDKTKTKHPLLSRLHALPMSCLCCASASPARTELSGMLQGVQLRSAAAAARGRRLAASLTALRLSAERTQDPQLLQNRRVVAVALEAVLRRVSTFPPVLESRQLLKRPPPY